MAVSFTHLGPAHLPSVDQGAEYCDAALAYARYGGDGFLDFLGMTAGADDVLDAAGDGNVSAGHVGSVATVEPAIVDELTRFRFVAEITRRRRRSTKL